ncbi:type III-B CRISPR-associated protein Cas10/Cmr2 [Aerosakkonema sp. BLCC-F183]|uniref:type III-B CRISPR-associated protein Cas10/Cmr2 n=1 Tax=Aerosakkonema sp. BLCC-F183 TaxID=3342834 RepID=UPI0035B74A4D
MSNFQQDIKTASGKLFVGIAWCLAWGEQRQPQFDIKELHQMREALHAGTDIPEKMRSLLEQVKQLETLKFPKTLDELKLLAEQHSILWNSRIGLVYGGATKIKQYVFEAAKLPDIRGASALLDRINLSDLPAFFNKNPESILYNYTIQCQEVRTWLNDNFPNEPKFSDALIPELIIYSTGGNILAFCPAAFADDLANAIEKRYTEETLAANSCAVADTFRLMETRFGLLQDPIENNFWLERYRQEYNKPLVRAYFGNLEKKPNEPCISDPVSVEEAFANRKSFNELTTKLAILFNQRRSGNDFPDRPSRRYPPMFETHPYLRRDEGDRRSAVAIVQPPLLPSESQFSEVSARKRRVGDRAKTGLAKTPEWYKNTGLEWQPGIIEGWVDKFEEFLQKNSEQCQQYYQTCQQDDVKIAKSLTHLGNVSNGFVAYIYADGNNMGGFIQKICTTPEKYKEFSEDVANATEYAVYQALAYNLHPRQIRGIKDPDSRWQDGDFIHPFEIITIGGDDIILIVPASQALAIAKMIGEQFEKILLKQVSLAGVEIQGNYHTKQSEKPIDLKKCHRYSSEKAELSQCQLSISSGVLITAYNTPIYYAKNLYEQLLKSAKSKAKKLRKYGYCGGTVDFLVLKAVTMISSDIDEFRKQALIKNPEVKIKDIHTPTLKLYAAPYTLHELGGLIETIDALNKAKFPRSQLYQIRDLLERGKHTAILNYRYFRVRLQQGQQELKEKFEEAWCQPKEQNNKGNLAPWMSILEPGETTYETIWRELVDLYDFIETSEDSGTSQERLVTQEAD